MATKKKQIFDQSKEVRAIARERIGTVKPSRPIEPDERKRAKKPKHKKPVTPETEAGFAK